MLNFLLKPEMLSFIGLRPEDVGLVHINILLLMLCLVLEVKNNPCFTSLEPTPPSPPSPSHEAKCVKHQTFIYFSRIHFLN